MNRRFLGAVVTLLRTRLSAEFFPLSRTQGGIGERRLQSGRQPAFRNNEGVLLDHEEGEAAKIGTC